MAHAYTPGLKVTPVTTVRKTRRLPLKGRVIVAKGERVKADQVVARTELPGKVHTVNLANVLNVPPDEVPHVCLKKEGDTVEIGEVLARTSGFFGLLKQVCVSPIAGTLESISRVTGQALLRERPIPVEVRAYVSGQVVEVIPDEGVIVESEAALVQGIFGLGGEVFAPLCVVAKSPDERLDAKSLGPEHRGKLLLGGGLLTLDAAKRAGELGVAGIIAGGFHYQDVRELLGRDLGVAITGTENIGSTLVITEGFGDIAMAHGTYELLAKHEGRAASASGATQIRAGVIRPEVIVGLEGQEIVREAGPASDIGLDVGSLVRGIRHPWFGGIGRVKSLPVELQEMPSGSSLRVVEVAFENGQTAVLPRANIETIER